MLARRALCILPQVLQNAAPANYKQTHVYVHSFILDNLPNPNTRKFHEILYICSQEWRHSTTVVASIRYPRHSGQIRCGFTSRRYARLAGPAIFHSLSLLRRSESKKFFPISVYTAMYTYICTYTLHFRFAYSHISPVASERYISNPPFSSLLSRGPFSGTHTHTHTHTHIRTSIPFLSREWRAERGRKSRENERRRLAPALHI